MHHAPGPALAALRRPSPASAAASSRASRLADGGPPKLQTAGMRITGATATTGSACQRRLARISDPIPTGSGPMATTRPRLMAASRSSGTTGVPQRVVGPR